jgi:hypothetical protein
MRLMWLSDLHLEFVGTESSRLFIREVVAEKPDAILNRLGDESADYIRTIAPKALERANHLLIATHVPPFVEAALYQNKPSDPNYAPHFVNLALGRLIRRVARKHPDKRITVLCGPPITILQVAANPYISALGKPETAKGHGVSWDAAPLRRKLLG